ncbi:MAG: hypothetical protein ACXW19_04450, partial [Thermoanaerobaculia bacterium]
HLSCASCDAVAEVWRVGIRLPRCEKGQFYVGGLFASIRYPNRRVELRSASAFDPPGSGQEYFGTRERPVYV